MRHVLTLIAAASVLSACASTGERTSTGPTTPTETPAAEFSLQPARFEDIPDWTRVDLAPALTAFRRACDGRRLRDPSASLPGGGRYGGTVADWAHACAAKGGERRREIDARPIRNVFKARGLQRELSGRRFGRCCWSRAGAFASACAS